MCYKTKMHRNNCLSEIRSRHPNHRFTALVQLSVDVLTPTCEPEWASVERGARPVEAGISESLMASRNFCHISSMRLVLCPPRQIKIAAPMPHKELAGINTPVVQAGRWKPGIFQSIWSTLRITLQTYPVPT
jgi:hypothetical protein